MTKKLFLSIKKLKPLLIKNIIQIKIFWIKKNKKINLRFQQMIQQMNLDLKILKF